MYSSGMRTARLLTVSRSIHREGGVSKHALGRGGLSQHALGGVGVSQHALGRGVSAQGAVSAWAGLPGGVVCGRHPLPLDQRQTPPNTWTDRHL